MPAQVGSEDLAYILSIQPDLAQANKGLAEVQKYLDTITAKGKKDIEQMFVAMSPTALHERLAIEQAIGRLKHEQYVEELKLGNTPELIRERMQREREIAAIKRDAARTERQERGIIGGVMDRMRAGGHEQMLAAILGGQGAKGMIAGGLGSLGGMVGEAAGGPVGALIGKMIGQGVAEVPGAVIGAVGKAIAAPAQLAAYGLNLFSSGLKELAGALGPIGAGLDLATESMKQFSGVLSAIPIVGGLLGPLMDTAVGVPGIIKDILTTLVSFTQTANPGAFYLWDYTLKSVVSTIGSSFLPVLEIMREAVALFGDTLANILPDFTEVRSALTEVRNAFMGFASEFRDALREIGPVIRDFLIDGLRQLSHWAAVAVRTLSLAVTELRGALGLRGGPGGFRGALPPAATAGMGSIEEYQRQLQLSAFRVPGTMSPQERMAQDIEDMAKVDTEARDLLKDIRKFLEVTPETWKRMEGFWTDFNKWTVENKLTFSDLSTSAKESLKWWRENGPILEDALKGLIQVIKFLTPKPTQEQIDWDNQHMKNLERGGEYIERPRPANPDLRW